MSPDASKPTTLAVGSGSAMAPQGRVPRGPAPGAGEAEAQSGGGLDRAARRRARERAHWPAAGSGPMRRRHRRCTGTPRCASARAITASTACWWPGGRGRVGRRDTRGGRHHGKTDDEGDICVSCVFQLLSDRGVCCGSTDSEVTSDTTTIVLARWGVDPIVAWYKANEMPYRGRTVTRGDYGTEETTGPCATASRHHATLAGSVCANRAMRSGSGAGGMGATGRCPSTGDSERASATRSPVSSATVPSPHAKGSSGSAPASASPPASPTLDSHEDDTRTADHTTRRPAVRGELPQRSGLEHHDVGGIGEPNAKRDRGRGRSTRPRRSGRRPCVGRRPTRRSSRHGCSTYSSPPAAFSSATIAATAVIDVPRPATVQRTVPPARSRRARPRPWRRRRRATRACGNRDLDGATRGPGGERVRTVRRHRGHVDGDRDASAHGVGPADGARLGRRGQPARSLAVVVAEWAEFTPALRALDQHALAQRPSPTPPTIGMTKVNACSKSGSVLTAGQG